MRGTCLMLCLWGLGLGLGIHRMLTTAVMRWYTVMWPFQKRVVICRSEGGSRVQRDNTEISATPQVRVPMPSHIECLRSDDRTLMRRVWSRVGPYPHGMKEIQMSYEPELVSQLRWIVYCKAYCSGLTLLVQRVTLGSCQVRLQLSRRYMIRQTILPDTTRVCTTRRVLLLSLFTCVHNTLQSSAVICSHWDLSFSMAD